MIYLKYKRIVKNLLKNIILKLKSFISSLIKIYDVYNEKNEQ
jgi:hypothetical protein